jgi:DNA modification methylase
MGELLDYPNDTLRFKYFVRESAEHPAKLELRTLIWLIERYTNPGDTIMDPMSGIGSIHIGATMGRHTIGCEISDRFAEIHRLNIAKLESEQGFTSGATATLLHGDCRRFLPLAQPVDAVIFSPPYGSVQKEGTSTGFRDQATGEKVWGGDFGYSAQDANVGNIANYPLYLLAMLEIYKVCYASLKPGGVMVSVVKDYILKNTRVYCSKDNAMRAVQAGFILEDWHFRRAPIRALTQGSHIKRRQIKGTDRQELHIEVEDLLILRKRG